MVTTKKAAAESEKKKGELMENDQDAMEVIEMFCVSPVKRPSASSCFLWLFVVFGLKSCEGCGYFAVQGQPCPSHRLNSLQVLELGLLRPCSVAAVPVLVVLLHCRGEDISQSCDCSVIAGNLLAGCLLLLSSCCFFCMAVIISE